MQQAKSSVWSSFTLINENEVKCNLCQVKLAYHKSTTTMHNHLRVKHPVEVTLGSGQQSVASFMVRSPKMNDKRAEQLTALLTRMIAKDMLPISFVEGEGFRDLMQFLEPEYKIPSRKTITCRLEKLQEESASVLRNNLANAHRVALTTDSWTALTESYVTVTCHYMLQWEMKSAVLQTKAMP